MTKIQYNYTKYEFNRPTQLTENEYETLKTILNERPRYNINPPVSFVDNFRIELISLGICIIILFIASLSKWLEWLGILTLFVVGASFLFSFLPSFFSYRGLVYEKETYYIGLKNDIKKSNNYHEFLMLSNKRNGYNTK